MGLLDDINRAEKLSSPGSDININRISPVSIDVIDQRHAALQGGNLESQDVDEDPALQEEKFKQILEKTKGLREKLKE